MDWEKLAAAVVEKRSWFCCWLSACSRDCCDFLSAWILREIYWQQCKINDFGLYWQLLFSPRAGKWWCVNCVLLFWRQVLGYFCSRCSVHFSMPTTSLWDSASLSFATAARKPSTFEGWSSVSSTPSCQVRPRSRSDSYLCGREKCFIWDVFMTGKDQQTRSCGQTAALRGKTSESAILNQSWVWI